jgi:transcriptional regulator GlxA family with amidase domain
MRELAILLPKGTKTFSSIVLTLEILEEANQYYISKGRNEVFKIVLVGDPKGPKKKTSFTAHVDKKIDDYDSADLIIVPSLGNDIAACLKQNKKIIEWVISQYRKGAEIASLCTGAFILASAGLLDGKQCSTHWGAAATFQTMFPKVDLTIDRIITEEHGVYTTGGALSSLNLVLHIVEKYYDRETAIHIAKVFEIDLNRSSQSAFIIFTGQKDHEDVEIKKAQLYIEKNFSDKIIVESLSTKFSIDRRNFDRRFKKATGNSPLEYMQRVKVEAAKKWLETSRKTISEVMYDVGYADVKAFRELFKKVTGLSPIDYRARYNKEARVE